jgi:hypothetical protein
MGSGVEIRKRCFDHLRRFPQLVPGEAREPVGEERWRHAAEGMVQEQAHLRVFVETEVPEEGAIDEPAVHPCGNPRDSEPVAGGVLHDDAGFGQERARGHYGRGRNKLAGLVSDEADLGPALTLNEGLLSHREKEQRLEAQRQAGPELAQGGRGVRGSLLFSSQLEVQMRESRTALSRGRNLLAPVHRNGRIEVDVAGVASGARAPRIRDPALEPKHFFLEAIQVGINGNPAVGMAQIKGPSVPSPFDLQAVDDTIGDGEYGKTDAATRGEIHAGMQVIGSIFAEG